MECAGLAVAENIIASKRGKICIIFSGVGRNGGDGMVAARHLAGRGFEVSVVLVGPEEKVVDPNVVENWNALKRMRSSVEVFMAKDSSLLPKPSAPIIVDALLGIGAKGKLLPPILQAVQTVNKSNSFCVAVDVPTGIDATTGEKLGEAVKANMTVTFHKPKTGLLKAKEYVGKLVVADVGIPMEAEAYSGPGDVLKVRKPRPLDAHKGDLGRVLVVGGSETYVGAPALSGLAALQTGVDLVYVAAPLRTGYTISSYSPNLITLKLGEDAFSRADVETLQPFLRQATSIILGPGLGTKPETVSAVKALLSIVEKLRVPLLLDADGLKIFSQLKRSLRTAYVLTPHTTEYAILTGEKPPSNLDDRGRQVVEVARRLRTVIFLKGNVDVVSDGRRVKFNWTGNPGMTVGGTGDTLAGVIGGFMAQGINPYEAAVAGGFINGAAGDLVYSKKGYHILPTDIIAKLPKVIEKPQIHKEHVSGYR
jgi:NAD(P)H-hydrate epimerase